MRTLLQFLARYSILLLFLLLETVAFILLVRHNSYQQSAVFSSANRVSAGLYSISSNITSYFSLRKQNEVLLDENESLKNKITALENAVEAVKEDSMLSYVYADNNLHYKAAKVINATTNLQRNYITINKGLRDGVTADMGVVAKDRVVGIVSAASDKFAVVIPVLNPLLTISCKLQKNNQVGALHWDGRDYRYAEMLDVARHIEVSEGDTVVTSGLSEVFPENILIGVIEKVVLTESDAYYNIRVRLAVDFRSIQYVTVIENKNRAEKLKLEKEKIK